MVLYADNWWAVLLAILLFAVLAMISYNHDR